MQLGMECLTECAAVDFYREYFGKYHEKDRPDDAQRRLEEEKLCEKGGESVTVERKG